MIKFIWHKNPDYFSLSYIYYGAQFIAPPCIPVRDKEKAIIAEEALANKFHFIFEGSRYTYPQFLDGIDQFNFQFDDNTRRSKTLKEVAPGKQYIHPTGGLFVRVLKDDHGWAMFVVMKNRNLVNIDGSTHDLERSFIKEFCMFIHESWWYSAFDPSMILSPYFCNINGKKIHVNRT